MTRILTMAAIPVGGAAACLLLLGCATMPVPGTGAMTPSGIEGRTMVDGGCPVIRSDSPCPDKPLAAKLTVTRAGSARTVATATSDSHGYFRLPLSPGKYVVRPENLTGAVVPIAQPLTVTVVAGRFTTVTISFDSGIR
jgi:hypothetical protein